MEQLQRFEVPEGTIVHINGMPFRMPPFAHVLGTAHNFEMAHRMGGGVNPVKVASEIQVTEDGTVIPPPIPPAMQELIEWTRRQWAECPVLGPQASTRAAEAEAELQQLRQALAEGLGIDVETLRSRLPDDPAATPEQTKRSYRTALALLRIQGPTAEELHAHYRQKLSKLGLS